MKLNEITSKIDCKVIGKPKVKILSIVNKAQQANIGSLFFCLESRRDDAEKWVNEAVKNGCRVIVSDQSFSIPKTVSQVIVPNTRIAMSQIASIFFGYPASKLKVIGVTGTNGKTTTTTMIAHVLSSKHKVGIIGTNGVVFGGKTIDTSMTTPDPIELHQILSQMAESGVEYVVMEMSAHAIYFQKLWGIMSDIIAFTNLSQDHLDFFENMDNYFEAKARLFKESRYNHAVVCVDTEYGKRLAQISKNVITCSSTNEKADIIVKNVANTKNSQTFCIVSNGKEHEFSINLQGKFNLQNAVVAISVLNFCDMTFDEIASSLRTLENVKGRYESYQMKNCTAIIDYAHTPDGLENLLVSTKTLCRGKLICVFSCGGNRDVEKRPIMGHIAEKYADFVFVTTDNPRFEDNYKIATDIVSGFSKNKWRMVLDRGQAIREAVKMASKNDWVVIAGKGAEPYIDVRGTKIEYSDKEVIKGLQQQ